MKIITRNNAQIFLLLNALFWGSSYIWQKMLLGFLPQFIILFICAVLGFAVTFVMFRKQIKSINKKAILISASISLVSVISNTFCMLALKRTSGSNTAFIVQLSIVITPLIMAVLERKMPATKTVILALTALVGIYMITSAGNGLNINIGDIFALCNAVFFSLFIALQNKFSQDVTPGQFTFVQHGTNMIAFLILALVFESGSISANSFQAPVLFLLIGLNAAVTIFTALFQSSAIKYVRPENATLIYSLEPVATAILGTLLLSEHFKGIEPVIGCAIILLAVVLSSVKLGNVPGKRFAKVRLTSNTR